MIEHVEVELDGFWGMVDITEKVREFVKKSGADEGAVLVFSIGSNGAVT